MATKYAHAAGDYATIDWYDAPSGGSVVADPGNGDTADANSYAITLAGGLSLTGVTFADSAGGGSFTPAGTVTLTSCVLGSSWVWSGSIRLNLNTACTISGTFTVTSSAYVVFGAACAITISGTASFACAYVFPSTATLTVSGSLTINAASTFAPALTVAAGGTVNLINANMTSMTIPSVAGTLQLAGTRVYGVSQLQSKKRLRFG